MVATPPRLVTRTIADGNDAKVGSNDREPHRKMERVLVKVQS